MSKIIPATQHLQWLAVHGLLQLDDSVTRKLAEPVTLGDLAHDTLATRIANGIPFDQVDTAIEEVEAAVRSHGPGTQIHAGSETFDRADPSTWGGRASLSDIQTHSLDWLLGELQGLAARIKPLRKYHAKRRGAAA